MRSSIEWLWLMALSSSGLLITMIDLHLKNIVGIVAAAALTIVSVSIAREGQTDIKLTNLKGWNIYLESSNATCKRYWNSSMQEHTSSMEAIWDYSGIARIKTYHGIISLYFIESCKATTWELEHSTCLEWIHLKTHLMFCNQHIWLLTRMVLKSGSSEKSRFSKCVQTLVPKTKMSVSFRFDDHSLQWVLILATNRRT